MKNVISVELMKKSDEMAIAKYGVSHLIKKAGVALFKSYRYPGKTAIVVGVGNNAADGYRLGKLLIDSGKSVTFFRCSTKVSSDALEFYNAVKDIAPFYMIDDVSEIMNYDTVVDAIFGTGFRGVPEGAFLKAINLINSSDAYIVSCDINSGLNGNNGLATYAVKSDLTVSLGYYKYGHFLNQAKDYIGKLVNCDVDISLINTDGYLFELKEANKTLPKRNEFSNKGTYGYVGIMGGSKNYPGAVRLAGMGQDALYSGAGVSRIIVPNELADVIRNSSLEATVYPLSSVDGSFVFDEEGLKSAIKGLRVLSIGVGIGTGSEIEKILSYLLRNYEGSLIIDADALNVLAKMDLMLLNQSKAKIVLTPHLKELSRLTGYKVDEIMNSTIEIGKEFINKYNVTLLIKGPTTVILNRDGMYFVKIGNSGMATAGSGDVLTGILTGVLGYLSNNILEGVTFGAFLNGLAGNIASYLYGKYGMVSSDTARSVSKAMKIIEEEED